MFSLVGESGWQNLFSISGTSEFCIGRSAVPLLIPVIFQQPSEDSIYGNASSPETSHLPRCCMAWFGERRLIVKAKPSEPPFLTTAL
ncbi:hypothetical protein AVEN_92236-1 [Araneus ventricosus]|uniref:Uncharacterized protein n=1 Tax=Araneus ventricosus TaxID=182803 RepID=A0A4Y2AM48_ARAVE|nr:hypothetical protein AVEN_92236-1 [Araneus ventricosus]